MAPTSNRNSAVNGRAKGPARLASKRVRVLQKLRIERQRVFFMAAKDPAPRR